MCYKGYILPNQQFLLMERSEILNLEIRRKIYNYIKDNPGLHLRELSRRLNLSYYNLDYHVKYLKKLELVEIKIDNSYSRVYVSNSIGSNHKAILSIMRQKTPRYILMFNMIYKVTTSKEIAEDLGKHPTTIKFHLDKLIKLGLMEPAVSQNGVVYINNKRCSKVTRSPVKNETLYKIKDYDLIKKYFMAYDKSFYNDKIFKEILEYARWLTIEFDKQRNGKRLTHFKSYKNRESKLDKRLLKVVNDVFPHPYHNGSWFL